MSFALSIPYAELSVPSTSHFTEWEIVAFSVALQITEKQFLTNVTKFNAEMKITNVNFYLKEHIYKI